MTKVLMFPSTPRGLATAIANSLGAAEMLAGPVADAIPVVEKEIVGGDVQAAMAEEDAYHFNEKPVAKSSTNILISTPGQVACQVCGCLPADDMGRTGGRTKKGCTCKCHKP